MTYKRTLKYCWLKLRRLQGDPKKLAWGMALGVFIGVTPTLPFHTIIALSLAAFLRISLVTAYMGIWISNPVTWVPQYFLAYEVGRRLLFRGTPLHLPEHLSFSACFDLLWRGGLALQVGGLIIAVPPAVASYFLTLWAIKRYRQRRARENQRVTLLPQDHTPASRPEA